MPVSATAARIYVNVPDALTLNQAALDATYAGIVALNATGVRITVPWKSVQPSDARYFTWGGTDLAVNRALTAGLRVMLVLSPPKPFWTATINPTLFAAFAGAAALRYKARGAGLTAANAAKSVAEYQVWDAPNIKASWPGSASNEPTNYGEFLKASSAAIKGSDPSAVVVFGALRPCATTLDGSRVRENYINVEPSVFLEEMYASYNASFDVLAYDPLSVTTTQQPTPRPPSGDSISAAHDRLYGKMSAVTASVRGGRPTAVPPKKVYWTAVGYNLTQFTQYQQALYLDTIRRLAQTRPEVTGIGVLSFRDFLS